MAPLARTGPGPQGGQGRPGVTREVRVLQVLPRSAGGIGRHVAQIVSWFDEKDDITVDVAGPEMPVAMPKESVRVNIPDSPSRGHARAVVELHGLIRRGAYRVVHAHGLRAGIDAGLGVKGTEARVVLTVHNLIHSGLSGPRRVRLLGWAEPAALVLSDAVVAPSEEIASHLRRLAGGKRRPIQVVYARAQTPAVTRPAAEVRAGLGLTEDQRLVVSVARLHPQKALHVMIEAISRLDPEVVLAIVGEGPLRASLERLAGELGVSDRVLWPGWRDDAGDFIAAADAFCLSSVWEAVALAAQEAVLLGTPVVSTEVGGMPELIKDGASGRLVSPGDADALARGIRDVLDPQIGRRYADAAASAYAQRFSGEAMLGRLEALYREMAG